MATLAGLRETGLRVVGVRCLLKIRQVATHAGCRRPGKFSSDVAGHAIKRAVRSSQGESSLLEVVEFCSQPVVGVVALLAGCGETAGDVIGLSSLVILCMTGIALCRQSLELSRWQRLCGRTRNPARHERQSVGNGSDAD